MNVLHDVHHRLWAAYDLPPVREARHLSGGMFMKPVLVTTDRGRYVLRGTRFRSTTAAFAFQAQAMNRAAERGIRCTRVLRDRDGNHGHRMDGAVWAVCTYLEGATWPWPRWWRAKREQSGFIENVAAQVARLHDVLAEAGTEGDPALSPELPPIQFACLEAVRTHWDRSIAALAALDAIAAERSRETLLRHRRAIASHLQWLAGMLAAGGLDELPRQIVHGDVSPVNILFQEATDRIGFVDWDTVHVGHRLYDALGDVLNRPPADDPRHHRLRMELVRRYLIGYRQATQRPLSDQELALVGPFCLSRQLEDLRQRLHVLPDLPADDDAQYAALIEIRVGMMEQIRAIDAGDWIP